MLHSEPAGRVPGIWWLIRCWAGKHTPECHQTSGTCTRKPEISCHQKDVCPLETTSRAHFVIGSWDSEPGDKGRSRPGLAQSSLPVQVSTLSPNQTSLCLPSCLGPLCSFSSPSPGLGSCCPFTIWSRAHELLAGVNHRAPRLPSMCSEYLSDIKENFIHQTVTVK